MSDVSDLKGMAQVLKDLREQDSQFLDRYSDQIQTLRDALQRVENSEKKFWVVHQKPVAVGIVAISILVTFVAVMINLSTTGIQESYLRSSLFLLVEQPET